MNYNQLCETYQKQKDLLESGNTAINFCGYRYLAKGLDCIDYFEQNYEITLDLSMESLEMMDEWMHLIHEENQKEAFDYQPFAEMITGYVSLVMDELFHGTWVYDDENEAYEINTNHIYLKESINELIKQDQTISEYIKEIQKYL